MAKAWGSVGDRGGKEQRWRQEISAWRGSGEKQSDFCRRRGLKRDQFVYWKRRLEERDGGRETAASIQLFEVPAAKKTAKLSSAGVAVVGKGDWRIELEPGFDESTLSRALAVLGASR